MNLFDKLKYRNLNIYKQYEYEKLQQVGTLPQVVDFVELLGCYDYLYLIKFEDLWKSFDFYYNKLLNNYKKISKSEFQSDIISLLKIRNVNSVVSLINEGKDGYEIAKIIKGYVPNTIKSSKMLDRCGQIDPLELSCSINILLNATKKYNTQNLQIAYNKTLKDKLHSALLESHKFKFYSNILINVYNKAKRTDREYIQKNIQEGRAKNIALFLNNSAYLALNNISKHHIDNNELQDKLFKDYSDLIYSSFKSQKSFNDKLFRTV